MTELPSENITRLSLLVRIRDSHDVDAWKSFVSIYAPLILTYCRSRGLQQADAEDVTQEVFGKINRSISRFEYQPERGRFRDWLGTVTYGELCRVMAKNQRGVRGLGGSNDHPQLDQVSTQSLGNDWTDYFHAHILSTALDQIRPQFEPATWNAFERVWLHEQSSADVAKELSMPIEAIYVAKSRVLKRLRETVLELADEMPTSVARG